MSLTRKEIFDRNFGAFVDISEEAYDFLDTHFKEMHYKQREFITEAGKVDRYFHFVVSGVQAMYLIDSSGDQRVIAFSFNGSPSGVYYSFLDQSPSDLFVEALTPSTLIAISLEDYEELFRLFPEFYVWRSRFMEMILFGRGKREVELLTQSAKERFDAFFSRCPPELKTIPQKYLASYLNMKPETLSRMRAIRD